MEMVAVANTGISIHPLDEVIVWQDVEVLKVILVDMGPNVHSIAIIVNKIGIGIEVCTDLQVLRLDI